MPPAGAHGAQTLPTLAGNEPLAQGPFRDVHGSSHQGHVRPSNEDHFLFVDVERVLSVRGSSLGATQRERRSIGTLLVVADGMGGHTNGELASAVTIDTIAAFAARALPVDPEDGEVTTGAHEGFQAVARECQRRVREAAARKGAPLDLGSTLTALYAHAGCAEIAHVGDSRVYLVRPGTGMWRLTHDHTLGASLESATGQAAPGVAHILTNAIGATDEEPRVEALHVPMAVGDRYLLCTDGLTNYVEDEAIGAVLGGASTALDAVSQLMQLTLQTEARDNVTVVVAFV